MVQPYRVFSTCPGYNDFANNVPSQLHAFTDSIYPQGRIDFKSNTSVDIGDIENLYPLLGVEAGTTFELIGQSQSKLNPDKYYYQYQQYYNGIIVEGGGYTIAASPNPGARPDCNPAVYYSLSPSIISGINLNTSNTVPESSIVGIVNVPIITNSKLVVVKNVQNNCAIKLAWRTDYNKGGSKRSWVDARSGEILKTVDSDQNLIAPVDNYGDANGRVDLDDTFFSDENVTRLISADERVYTYNHNGLTLSTLQDSNAPWYDAEQIVTTSRTDHWPFDGQQTGPLEGREVAYQSHYVAGKIIPVMDDLFGPNQIIPEIHIAANESRFRDSPRNIFNASNTNNAFLYVGKFKPVFNAPEPAQNAAQIDIIAHELGHAYLNNFDLLDYNNPGNQSLQEAIADIIAIYIEAYSNQQGVHDWVMGDGDDGYSFPARDLANIDETCYTNVINIENAHARARPLRHWFYLITEGSPADGIPALGLEQATNIVMETLKNLNNVNADYEDFKEASLLTIDEAYGLCSDESTAIRKAWNEICVGYEDDCSFRVYFDVDYCEEDQEEDVFFIHSCVQGGLPGQAFRWTFPIDWTVYGSPSNSNRYNGRCLRVEAIPDYDYYPRTFEVSVYSSTSNREIRKTITIRDCEGDDPTCADTESVEGGDIATIYSEVGNRQIISPKSEKVKIFDITGKLHYDGSLKDYDNHLIDYSGLLIRSFFSENDQFIKSEKFIIFK